MKQHITIEDLSQLSSGQKERLRYLWVPKKYDLAYAEICKNAQYDEYDKYEFVIGRVDITYSDDLGGFRRSANNSCSVTLQDISFMKGPDDTDENTDEAGEIDTPPETVYGNENDETETTGDDYNDTGFLDNVFGSETPVEEYSRPTFNSLEECLPLLGLGDMIEMLKNSRNQHLFKMNTEQNHFNICISSDDYYDDDTNTENLELCDVLWQTVLKLL